jgi:uncharacterized protein (UPF0335 family)
MKGKSMSEEREQVIDAEPLNNYVNRVASLMREQQTLAEDIKELCASADEAGVASKREIRKLARETLLEPEVLDAQLTRMQDLRDALRSFASTPLGAAAVKREAEVVEMPHPFAAQTIHDPARPRGRRRKSPAEALFGGDPVDAA